MRILFIYPNIYSYYATGGYHHGIASISSVLRQNGHETRLFSANKYSEVKIILKEITRFNPKIVAFSATSSQFRHVQRLSKEIKREFDVMTIAGGVHPTLMPTCIEESEGLDAICRGEGEYPMLDLINAIENGKGYLEIKNLWFKKEREIIKNELRPLISNLDKLPFEDREIFDYQKVIDDKRRPGYAHFMFSRGCPFKCTYCCNHALSRLYQGKGNYLRFRGIEKSLEEIEMVTRKYKVKTLMFNDDTFSVNKDWFSMFLTEYRKRFNYPFGCGIRPGTCSREMFQMLKDAGCTFVEIGVESGNPRILKEIMKREISIEQIKETFRNAHEVGLRTSASNIIGLPGETVETIKDTIKLNAELNPTSTAAGIFYPYPGTDLREFCEAKGYAIRNIGASDKFIERQEAIVELPTISRKELLYYVKNFKYLVYKEYSPKKALLNRVMNTQARLLVKSITLFIPHRLRERIAKALLK